MSNVAVIARGLVANWEHDPVGLRNLRFDEFSASPVDEVQRAIEATEQRSVEEKIEKFIFGHPHFDEESIHDFLQSEMLRLLSREIEASLLDANEEPPTQLGLRVTGDFSPSRKLTDLWIESLVALGKEARRPTFVSSDFEVAQEFSHLLSSLFGTIGQQLRFQSKAELAVTRHGRFLPSYQIQLCDTFLIIPDQAAAFLEILRAEMHEGIISSNYQISGAWGNICATRDGELHLVLEPPALIPVGDFEESEEIE